MNVSCSSSSAHELGASLGELISEELSWAASGAWVGGLWGHEGVACTTTTRVNVLAGVWVWLGDLVERWHPY